MLRRVPACCAVCQSVVAFTPTVTASPLPWNHRLAQTVYLQIGSDGLPSSASTSFAHCPTTRRSARGSEGGDAHRTRDGRNLSASRGSGSQADFARTGRLAHAYLIISPRGHGASRLCPTYISLALRERHHDEPRA